MPRCIIIVTLLIHIHLSSALNRETIVSIDDKDKTQYHEVNFDTRSYNFGYEVGTNRQFHHEIRGSDGVTYGCFGYFDEDNKLLMTHYVADAHGYRLIESNKPVKIYPVVAVDAKPDKSENAIDSRNTMVLTEWKDLYLPRGCRMMESGNFNQFGAGGANKEQQQLKTDLTIPHPGIGISHIHEKPSHIHEKPSHTHTPVSAGIGGSFTGAHGTSISHGIGSSHGQAQTPPPAQNQQQQQQSQGGGSGFGIGGHFTGAHGSQGSFQFGITKPPLHHTSSSSSPSSSSSSSTSSSHGHGHGSIIGSHLHTTKKPGHFEHGGSFSHGSVSGGHHISHGHGQQANRTTTTKKPHHFELIHTTSKKPGHIEHGGSFSHGSVNGSYQSSISWGNQGQTTSTTKKPATMTTTKKPTGGHIDHGGSFSHGSVSGSHQGGISWGNQGQTTTTKKPTTTPTKTTTTTRKPTTGGNTGQGGSGGNHQGGGGNQGGNQGGGNQGGNQGGGGGYYGGGGDHYGGGYYQGGNQGGGYYGGNYGNNYGHGGYHYQPGGGGQYYGGGGYYRPDYSGSYVHQPGPNAPPYQHVTGPWGGQGHGGGQGGNGGYGNGGGNGPYGPNGPNGPYGPDYNQGGHNQGGHRPDPNNPDADCNNPSHHHETSTAGPFYTKSTSQRPTTKTTTQRTTTSRPQTYPTRPSSTPNPTDNGQSNLGVQPPSTRPPPPLPHYEGTNQPAHPQPLFFVPYPYPLAPTCPCYYMHNGSTSGQQQQQQQQMQNPPPQAYAIGLIPVLFVPHCMTDNKFAGAQFASPFLQVPYTCAQCNQRDGRELNEVFSSSDSFKQVLEQAGVDDTFVVKSQPRGQRMRRPWRRVKARVQKVEEEQQEAQ